MEMVNKIAETVKFMYIFSLIHLLVNITLIWCVMQLLTFYGQISA